MRLLSSNLAPCVALALASACATCKAEIYILNQGQDEHSTIHITNIPGRPDFEVLVASHTSQSEVAGSTVPPPPSRPVIRHLYAHAVAVAAKETNLHPSLLHAVITAESGGDPKAISPKGARGLMQLMPATGRDMGLADPFDPVENVLAGARYLQRLKQQFGSIELALAAYNAGPAVVTRYGNRVPPFDETMRYVEKVMRLASLSQQ